MKKQCLSLLAFAAEAMCLWPAVPKGLERQVIAPRPHLREAERKKGPRHQWQFVLGRWSCKACLAIVFSAARRKARRNEICSQDAGQLKQIVANPQGHRLACVDAEGAALIFCEVCGGYATNKGKSLHKPCVGKPAKRSWGREALKRIAEGRHPDRHQHRSGIRLQAVLSLRSGDVRSEFAWVAAALEEEEEPGGLAEDARPPPQPTAAERLATLRHRIAQTAAAAASKA